MPTYDYACEACGHRFELYQGISDPVEKTCPKCRKRKLTRLIGTGAAVLFKGTGFYQTDYRSPSYTEGEKKDSPGCAGSPAKCDKPSCPSKNDD